MGRKRTSTKIRTSISIEKDLDENVAYIVDKLKTNKSVFFSEAAIRYIEELEEKTKK